MEPGLPVKTQESPLHRGTILVESSVTGHRNFDRVLSFKTLVFELEADSELSRYYDCFSLDRFFSRCRQMNIVSPVVRFGCRTKEVEMPVILLSREVNKILIISARCNICISRLCYDVSVRLSVCLSVCPSVCDGGALWSPCIPGRGEGHLAL